MNILKKSNSASSFGSDGYWNYTKKRVSHKPMKFKIEYFEKVMLENDNSIKSDESEQEIVR